jgi:hypothetical protein
MEPPPAPFIIAPGEYTLYHEWGHHVDRTWSGDNQEVLFSFRWLSRFYQISALSTRNPHAAYSFPVDDLELRPIDSDAHAADAVVLWWHASSELFANLFEDWMRGEKRVHWDHCEPKSLNASEARGRPFVRIALLPGVGAEDVRAETYAILTAGIRSAVDLPPVRPGLFGAKTDETIGRFRDVMAGMRADRPSSVRPSQNRCLPCPA